MKYVPVKIEAVYPDGTVGVRNAFVTENGAVKGEDPKWPREKLIAHATLWMQRWNETYSHHNAAKLRVVH